MDSVQAICSKYRITYDQNYELIKDYIFGLFNDKIIINHSTDSNVFLWNGLYYRLVEKDYELMKKNYLIAIQLNNSNAMANLGIFYQQLRKIM